jgi:hypothetical protein
MERGRNSISPRESHHHKKRGKKKTKRCMWGRKEEVYETDLSSNAVFFHEWVASQVNLQRVVRRQRHVQSSSKVLEKKNTNVTKSETRKSKIQHEQTDRPWGRDSSRSAKTICCSKADSGKCRFASNKTGIPSQGAFATAKKKKKEGGAGTTTQVSQCNQKALLE